jgi:hypothetical protein
MTSIDFIVKELKLEGYDYTIQQAKEMHKQEIEDAYNASMLNEGGERYNIVAGEKFNAFDNADDYYQETFGSKGSDDTLKDYHIVDTNEMVSFQTEISDEEIFKGILKHCSIPHDRILAEVNAMIDGAKWYREQLKSK